MSYADHPQHGMRPAPAVPFSEFTAPMEAVGQSVYVAGETVAKAIYSVFAAIARMVRQHRARNQLMALDDRTLQDIGVSRSEIRYIAQRVSDDPGYDHRRTGGL